ncbi:innexin unc-9-like isoform X3 [Liolophura sinensis]|uniref:innexin unc-9-like isoform X2 n=1 Tax=Liolophura sinensis TaxID=3198878 RepID=UPI003158DFE0
MLGAILGGSFSFKRLTGSKNDDWVDRLNHLWTVLLLVLFAIFVTTSQFAGEPIHCWVPAEFSGDWAAYTKSVCWISNTYYIPLKDTIPVDINERRDAEINYYQWIPLILLFMALMFKFPNLMWRMGNDGSGINLDKLITMSEGTQLGSPEDRDSTIKYIALYMDRWLETHREIRWNRLVRLRQKMSRYLFFVCAKKDGTYLTGYYMFIKVLYVINAIGQMFLLNAFLAMEYNLYGFEVISQLNHKGNLEGSPRFPRVTLCDFEIRQLQNLQRFTVQCVLPINLFNEKIFIFIWFWIVFVSVVTCANFIFWIYRIIFRQNRARYVKKYLRLLDEIAAGASDKPLCKKFADQYLRDDGIFVLRVVAKNSTNLVVADLILKLWRIFKDKPYNRKSIADTLSDHENANEKDSLA